MQADKWLEGVLLINSSLHIDLFLFIYLSAGFFFFFRWIAWLEV